MNGTAFSKTHTFTKKKRCPLLPRAFWVVFFLLTFFRLHAQYNIDRVLMAGRSALYY